MNPLFVAILSVAFSVAAQFSLKAGMSGAAVQALVKQPLSVSSLFAILTEKFVLGGFLLYGLGAVVWLMVLSRWDVSKAYPLVGLGFVFTAILGFAAGEHVTLARVLGVALISAGVLVVSQS